MAKCDGCGSELGHTPSCAWVVVGASAAEGVSGVRAPATRAEDDGPAYEDTARWLPEGAGERFWTAHQPNVLGGSIKRVPIKDDRRLMVHDELEVKCSKEDFKKALAELGDSVDVSLQAKAWMEGTWDLPEGCVAGPIETWKVLPDMLTLRVGQDGKQACYSIPYTELQRMLRHGGSGVFLLNGEKAYFVYPEQYAILEALKGWSQEDVEAFAVNDPDEPLAKVAQAVLAAQRAMVFPKDTKNRP
jgi:hypothetical protein